MGTIIDKYLDRIVHSANRDGVHAYRGQRKARWPLHSGATRRLIRDHGEQILEDPEYADLYLNYHRDFLIEPARTRGYGIEVGRNLTDLELLAKLQHFGAETGLIDFSWSPLVALWFASVDANHDGKVFMMDSSYPIGIAKVAGDGSAQGLRDVFTVPQGGQPILYWEPTGSGDAMARILRQRSVFVIGRPLVTPSAGVIEEITIEKDDKEVLLAELTVMDFNEVTLFQDVYGFAQASKRMPIPHLSANAYRRRADNYYQLGEYDKAIDDYSRSIDAAPATGLTYLLRANVLAASGRHEEAINDYDSADSAVTILQRGVQDVLLYNRGNSKVELGDLQGAIQDYTGAIRWDRTTPQTYYNRGNAHLDLYQFHEALVDYETASNLGGPPGPHEINYLCNKGIAQLALGQLSEARDTYQDAMKVGNSHEVIHQNFWTLNRIIALVHGLDYAVRALPDGETENMCVRFSLPKGYERVGREIQRLVLLGRAGNIGNTGGPGLTGVGGLTGGKGFKGGPAIRVYADTDQ